MTDRDLLGQAAREAREVVIEAIIKTARAAVIKAAREDRQAIEVVIETARKAVKAAIDAKDAADVIYKAAIDDAVRDARARAFGAAIDALRDARADYAAYDESN